MGTDDTQQIHDFRTVMTGELHHCCCVTRFGRGWFCGTREASGDAYAAGLERGL